MSIVATIEARMTSSRLPGKMMLALGGKPVLAALIERLKLVPALDHIVLATTSNATDDILANVANGLGIGVFRGSENDVLGRVRGALDSVNAKVCVEVSGDCPLSDPAMITAMIREFQMTRQINAYISNVTGPSPGAPPGFDIEIFDADALRVIDREIHDSDAREHVSTPFYRANEAARWRPRFVEYFSSDLCRRVWLSLDYREDYELIRAVYEELYPRDPAFGAQAAIEAALRRRDATQACLALRGRLTESP